jgi:hypothetical protein
MACYNFYVTHLPVRYLTEWEFGQIRPTYTSIQCVSLPAGARPALVLYHFPIPWVTSADSPVGKRSFRAAEHSPPSRAEAKNKLAYTSTPPIPL